MPTVSSSVSLGVLFTGIDRLTGPLGKMDSKLAGFGRRASGIGKRLSLGISIPVLAFGGAALKTSSDFEFAFNRVRALTGATAESIETLEDQAKKLGRSTNFSARQAAEGMGFLAQAGFDVAEIGKALPPVLNLAAAGAMDLGEAAELSSIVLKGYGFQAKEMTRVTDVLTKAQASATTTVQQLGEAFTLAGPVASGLGLRFEETAAVLTALAEGGYQASLGGTSLRRVLSRLANPTPQVRALLESFGIFKDDIVDTDGKIKSLIGTVELFERKGLGATEMLAIFGDRGGPGMIKVMEQGSEALRNFERKMDEAGGTAQRMADIQMDGARGGTLRLISAFEGLQIAIGDSGLLAGFTSLVERATDWITRMAEANPSTMRWVGNIAIAAAALGPLLFLIGQASLGIQGLIAGFGLVGPLIGKFAVMLFTQAIPAAWSFTAALLANPIGLTVALIVGLIAAGYLLIKHWKVVKEFFIRLWEEIRIGVTSAIDYVIDKLGPLAQIIPGIGLGRLALGTGDEARAAAQERRAARAAAEASAARASTTSRTETVERQEKRLAIAFEGLPRGTRVASDGDADIDLDMGFAMGGAL